MASRNPLFIVVLLATLVNASTVNSGEPLDVGSRLQLLADSSLIDRLSPGARLVLHRPEPRKSRSSWIGRGKATRSTTSPPSRMERSPASTDCADVQYSKDGSARESSRGELLCREPRRHPLGEARPRPLRVRRVETE